MNIKIESLSKENKKLFHKLSCYSTEFLTFIKPDFVLNELSRSKSVITKLYSLFNSNTKNFIVYRDKITEEDYVFCKTNKQLNKAWTKLVKELEDANLSREKDSLNLKIKATKIALENLEASYKKLEKGKNVK